MPNIGRHLITTADERTWKFDQPVIFLGEWCKPYERQHIWQKMNAIVAEPYGLDLKSKIQDNLECRRIEKILLTELTKILNDTHQTAYSERFWKILFGHWLRTYIETGLNRIKTIEYCIGKYEISGSTFIELSKAKLIPKNFESMFTLLESDSWNSTFDLQILRLIKDLNFKIDVDSSQLENLKHIESNLEKKSGIEPPKKRIFNYIKLSLKHFKKNNDALIINTYLPRFEEIKLNLRLGQLPKFWESESVKINCDENLELRDKLSLKSICVINDKYLSILSSMLFNFFPTCYLEGFHKLKVVANEIGFPKYPKFILTSNSYHSDEVFKYWSAVKAEEGVKYIIGQHGSNFGTHRFINPSVEEEICDTFLTWGWGNNSLNYKKTFIFKIVNKKLSTNPKGGLLLNQNPMDFRRNTWDSVSQHLKYFEDQKIFISNLSELIRRNTTIRLHGLYKTQKFREDLRWLEFDSKLKLNYYQGSFFSLLAKSRLVVHSYDSTGFLETLALNVPTMAFWQNGFDHLVPEAKPYYQELVEIGILHLTPKSISEKINNEWADIELWWNKSEVQKIRNKFCEQYARQIEKPIQELSNLLTKNIK
jgi:putative transferase (TIGR04331 family)